MELIPTYISEKAPSGEKLFFDLASKEEGFDKWTLFWDTHIDVHRSKKDGQCDFIFLGPPGLFFIEVKGGDFYESRNGLHRWGWLNSKTPLNEKHESPLAQAKGNMYSVMGYLKEKISNKIKFKNIFFAYGASHPEANLSGLKGDVEYDPIQVFYKNKESISSYIKGLESHFKENKYKHGSFKKLSDSDLLLIKRQLKSNFKCLTSSQKTEDNKKEILRLEGEQRLMLEGIDYSDSRILVEGAAGTGKTVMARFITENHLLDDKRILWLSFNRIFTNFIKEYFSTYGMIDVHTSVGFLKNYIQKMGEDIAFDDPNILTTFLNFFDESEFKKYDVIIIDEAQDILTIEYLLIIDEILNGGLKNGSWAIMLDKGEQAKVYNKLEDDALDMIRGYSNNRRYLEKNRRNSRKVVSEFSDYLKIKEPECLVELPGNVVVKDLSKFSIEDHAVRIEGYLKDIILENQLNSNDLIVLSSSSGEIFFRDTFNNQYFSSLGKTKQRFYLEDLSNSLNGKINFSNAIDYTPIQFCNIHAYKGMEKSSAILVWDKEDYETKALSSAHLFYTALTRVLNEVYILLISQENKALNFNE